ncbi:MAG: hypothetical protein VKI42_00750 [Synechococcaceae cyanobacterium]|nr:hypothetical protein [Synechococcaceae cyanobacterium]
MLAMIKDKSLVAAYNREAPDIVAAIRQRDDGGEIFACIYGSVRQCALA